MKCDINGKKRIGVKVGQNIYSGKIFCGQCDALFWLKNRRLQTTNEKITEWYCSNYIRQGKNRCSNIHLSEDMLDKLMIELSKRILNKDYKMEFEYALKSINSVLLESDMIRGEIEKLNLECENIKKRRNNILDKFVDGFIDDITYKEAHRRYTMEIDKYEENISNLKEQLEEVRYKEMRLNGIRKRFSLMKENNELLSADIINFVKRITVFEKYIIIEMELGMVYKIPFRIVTNSRRYNRGKLTKDIQFL